MDNQYQNTSLLLSRIADGDKDAFGIIYHQYFNKLLRYGCIIISDNNTVEDLVQELFTWILEHPEKIMHIKNLEIYLFQSLKRNLRNYAKEKVKINNHIQLASEHSIRKFVETIEDKIIEEETSTFNSTWVKNQLEQLPNHQKEIIYLRFYEGLSYEEIAEVFSTSNQVVRNYVSRALKHIRKAGSIQIILIIIFYILLF